MDNKPKPSIGAIIFWVIFAAAFLFAFDYGMKKQLRIDCSRPGSDALEMCEGVEPIERNN
jgi:hypothetical protein